MVTKVLLTVVALGFVVIVVLITLPPFVPDGRTSPKNECINNLRLLDGAVQEWALDHHKSETDVPTWADLDPYLRIGTNLLILKCRAGGTYSLGSVLKPPTCSIPGHVVPPYANTQTAAPKP